MPSINRAEIMGHLGRDPECRYLASGGEVANLSVATSERWTDRASGEKRERTEWHNVTVFGDGLVRFIRENVRKGDLVYIDGQLRTRKWQDQNGNDRYTTEIVVGMRGTFLLLGKPGGNGRGPDASAGSAAAGSVGGATAAELDDDLPF